MRAEAKRSVMTDGRGHGEQCASLSFRKQILQVGRKPGNEEKTGQVEEEGRKVLQETETPEAILEFLL